MEIVGIAFQILGGDLAGVVAAADKDGKVNLLSRASSCVYASACVPVFTGVHNRSDIAVRSGSTDSA